MLRASHRNSKISAYEESEGSFDYNKTPIAPLGTKSIAYLTPDESFWKRIVENAWLQCVLRLPSKRSLRAQNIGNLRVISKPLQSTIHLRGWSHNNPATDLLREIGSYVPTTAAGKCAHAKVLQKLSTIMGIKKGATNENTILTRNSKNARVENESIT